MNILLRALRSVPANPKAEAREFNEQATPAKWPMNADGKPKKWGDMCAAEKDMANRCRDLIADDQSRFADDVDRWRDKYREGC